MDRISKKIYSLVSVLTLPGLKYFDFRTTEKARAEIEFEAKVQELITLIKERAPHIMKNLWNFLEGGLKRHTMHTNLKKTRLVFLTL